MKQGVLYRIGIIEIISRNYIIENWKNNIPLKKIGKPEDVANACIFLASDLSASVTGGIIMADGGFRTI